MFSIMARAVYLLLAVTCAGSVAQAADLGDFNAAVEQAQSHNRVASGYLRTGNLDLAALELERLNESWREVQRRFAGDRPQVFEGNELYGRLWTVLSARLVAADLMLKSGRPDAARQSLEAIRGDLYELRKSAAVVVLADCVRDANAVMNKLMAFDDRTIDWDNPDTRNDLAGQAAHYRDLLTRCDKIANAPVRSDAEFRRLVDGARASVTLIPKAIAERDAGLLHRVLIELRSFDNLLAFRFG